MSTEKCPDCGVWVEPTEPYAPYCSLEHKAASSCEVDDGYDESDE